MDFVIKNDLYKREKYLSKIRGFYHENEIIKVITGVRRCGKSSIMNMIAAELIAEGVNKDNILYFNLDKRPFMHIHKPEQLDALIEQNSGAEGMKYLFIDEVQNVKGYETVINSWREEGDFSIFLTGSNSYLLSGELATKLTGRYLEFCIMPLSFDEYLAVKSFFGKPIAGDMEELRNYINEGGFPYAVRLATLADKRAYVRGLVDEIYEKDIKRRIRIKNRSVFESIMRYIINNFGATTSIQNIVDDFAHQGIAIKQSTVSRYIEALCSAKIIVACNRFDMKSRKSLTGEKKYYLSDLSFYFALNTDNRINFGPALENVLFIYAASKGYSVSIGRIGKLECDFILRNTALQYAYVQVAYTILESKDTEDREYRSLENIKGDNYPRYVMTTDVLLQKRNGILHENIMEFIKNNRDF